MVQFVKLGGLLSSASSIPAPLTSNIIVATRGQIATANLSIAQNSTSRRTHWSSSQGNITNIKCVDCNWYIANTFVPTGGGATITYKRYIEYPANTFHQVTWSGSGSLTMASGSSFFTSDVVLSSVTGLPLVIPANTKFWERTVKTSALSQTVPVIELPVSSQTLGIDDGNTNGVDLGNSGTISATSTVNTWGSVFIKGDIAANNAKAYAIFGDSIVWGTGDISSTDSKFNTGWLARAIGGAGIPYLKVGKGGMSCSDLAGSAAAAWNNLFSALTVNNVIFEYGVNDLRLGRTDTQLLADFQTNYARVTNGARKYQTTITPRSDSTDLYATTTNQTPKVDGTMSLLNTINANIRAGLANITGYIEAADLAMSARDSDIWSAPPAATTDGTHPNTVKATSMAAGWTP